MKNVVVLGSTGSIGVSALDVIKRHSHRFRVVGLSAGSNRDLLLKQAEEFCVDMLAVSSTDPVYTGDKTMFTGEDAATKLVIKTGPDIVVNGISGAAGFLPSLQAVRQGTTLALANKESLVIGGTFLTAEAKKNHAGIIPVDSEHSAIFQCLTGENTDHVRRIILTASGGPFRDRPAESFRDITPDEALNHPTWSMGKRITIDSATMMNKGLEIIEASWLFDVPINKIDVVIHPQSIIHSMVEYTDMSTKAQMGLPDMRVPIAYALAWPERIPLDLKPMTFDQEMRLEFFPPDESKFGSLEIARQAMEMPSILPCIMNASDEVAIDAFLTGRIRFDQIIEVVRQTMDSLSHEEVHDPEELTGLDKKARKTAEALIP